MERFYISDEASFESQLNDKQKIFPTKTFGAILNIGTQLTFTPPHTTHRTLPFTSLPPPHTSFQSNSPSAFILCRTLKSQNRYSNHQNKI